MIVEVAVPAERSRCVVYPLPWNTTSTLGTATNAEYFYDYAGQDPINNYDLSGASTVTIEDEPGAGGGGLGAYSFPGDSYLPEGEAGAGDLPGGPEGQDPKRIYETERVQSQTDLYHDLSNAKEREVIRDGYVGEYNPRPNNINHPYVEYQLDGTLGGKEGTYEVGGYWSGKYFTVTHAFFNEN